MLTKINNAHFPIERINLQNKFKIPLIKDLNSMEIINIYNNFSSIFPVNNSENLSTNVSKNLNNILDKFDVLFLDAFGVI